MLLYRLILALVLPVLLLRLVWRALRGTEPWALLNERLGGGPLTRTTPGTGTETGALWLHAASNGELASARPLIEALFARDPALKLLITTNTATARKMAQDWQADWARGRVEVRLAPLDARICLHRFLSRHAPRALLVIENELWPNRFAAVHGRGLPVIVAGGRMSVRSARRWRKTGLGPRLAETMTAVSAQDPTSEQGFRALGLDPVRLLPIVNLKTAIAAPRPGWTPDWTPGWPRAHTILAASTHPGEEEIVLDAFVKARTLSPDLHLILAPRHPRRAEDIARLIAARGLAYRRRSDSATTAATLQGVAVLLADTMGEMANWYAASAICFIGGSLVAKGGHTPFEPVAYGCAILTGPSVSNHAGAFDALFAAEAACCVTGPDELAREFTRAPHHTAALGEKAMAALAPLGGREAVEKLATAIIARISPYN